MEPEGSSPQSQGPATCFIHSQSNPVHAFSFQFLRIYFNIILPSTPRSSGRFPSSVPLHTPHLYPISSTWSAHLILLDFIIRKKKIGKEYTQ
jgi:hypothetical protein